ncbi:hypothetical protein ACLB2K_015783 [Fragaria x ananassa]
MERTAGELIVSLWTQLYFPLFRRAPLEFLPEDLLNAHRSLSSSARWHAPHTCFTFRSTITSSLPAEDVGQNRNDADRSEFSVDSSIQYEVVAVEYLGDGVVTEPGWLQFMREWGPKIVYNSRTELDKIINVLAVMLRYSVESIFSKIPVELSGEEGPTGPKEKNNWVGDERW